MTSASTISQPPRPGNRTGLVMLAHPLPIAMFVLAVATLLRIPGTVDSDVSWQLWIAHQLNGGAHLYRDIIEVNPPLWFWMAMPIDRLAGLIHVRADHVAIVAIGCLCALSLAGTDRLLPGTENSRRTLLLSYAALIFAIMPWMQVGQREQIVLVGAVPYAALIAARRDRRSISTVLALAIGIGAALGFALKQYFLFVPVLLELWLLAEQRRGWKLIRPETIALAAVGLSYAAAVLLWAPEFLSSIVPLVRLAYGVSGAPHLTDLLQPGVIAGTATLLVAGARYRAGGSFANALLVAGVGFLLAYVAQAKGWAYHALPLMGCASLALAAMLASGDKVPRLVALAAPALLLVPLGIGVQTAVQEGAPGPDLRRAVAGLKPGEPVGFLATDPALAWSVTLQHGLSYPSRYMSFWMMRAIVRNEANGSPDQRLTALGRAVVRETATDFRCMPPRRIIVARPRPGAPRDEFDILPFFMRDPEFASLLSHYRATERSTVEVYDLVKPFGAGPRNCVYRAP